MRASARLAGLELASPDGDPVALGDFWRERPAVVAWVRHFG